ncbi:unnamed protein product [Rotaria socialis]
MMCVDVAHIYTYNEYQVQIPQIDAKRKKSIRIFVTLVHFTTPTKRKQLISIKQNIHEEQPLYYSTLKIVFLLPY